MNQPTARPTRKMGAVGISGIIMFVLAWVSKEYINVEVPADIMAGFVAVVVWVVGYFVPERNASQDVEISSEDPKESC